MEFIMKKFRLFIFALVLSAILLPANLLFANNVSISDASLVDQNTDDDYVMIQFSLSWENSWRNSINWDACWIFVKYRDMYANEWKHVYLSATPGDHNTGSQGTAATINQDDKYGVFFNRSANGEGTFSSTDIKLRWNYGENEIPDEISTMVSDIKVLAIEMVYVPEGEFYAGLYGISSTTCALAGAPYGWNINSESAITTTASVNDGYYYVSGGGSGEDASGSIFTIPAEFPKGYMAFYSMKYEITQEQYVDYLNLSGIGIVGKIGELVFGGAARNGIYRISNKYDKPQYVCNLDNDANYNESNDGQNIACNFIDSVNCYRYANWACLRPMSELEYEKACKGPVTQIVQYAFGNGKISAFSLVNPNTENEQPFNSDANCNDSWSNGINGPMRVGCFATSGSNRTESGASYYGIMELTGNLYEGCITLGNSWGRNFIGNHGTGGLNDIWNLNACLGNRGGSINCTDAGPYSLISKLRLLVYDRIYISRTRSYYLYMEGLRCVRTAP